MRAAMDIRHHNDLFSEEFAPIARYPKLAAATFTQLATWWRTGGDDGIHWSGLQESLSIRGALGLG
jgi:hypothetical protein